MNALEKNTSVRCRVPFSKKEDSLLIKLVKQFGESNWEKISKFMENRSIRQCRERWQNSLSPKILKKNWTREEDKLLLEKYNMFGPHWKIIESFFYGRTSYSIRNRFNSLKKKNSEKFNCSLNNNEANNEKENTETSNCFNDSNYTDLLTYNYFEDYSIDLQNSIEIDMFHSFNINDY